MQRIVVLNPKGGSGKTTVATNLAAYYAENGLSPVLMDMDPQGSSTRWLRQRPANQGRIHGIAAFQRSPNVTRSFQLRVPTESERVVVDTAAALNPQQLPEITRTADAILVPVMPSDIDIHAAARCISDLLLVAKISREENRIGILANRVRTNTLVFQSLLRFLENLDIPIIATLRDSQNYVRSAEQGLGIHEMPRWRTRKDLLAWESVVQWLDSRNSRGRDGNMGMANPLPTPKFSNGPATSLARFPDSRVVTG